MFASLKQNWLSAKYHRTTNLTLWDRAVSYVIQTAEGSNELVWRRRRLAFPWSSSTKWVPVSPSGIRWFRICRATLSRESTGAATVLKKFQSTHAAAGSPPHSSDRTHSSRFVAPGPARHSAAPVDASRPTAAPSSGPPRCRQQPAPETPDNSKSPAAGAPPQR